jgi:hypothetical protein
MFPLGYMCDIEHSSKLCNAMEYGLFTCYDFSVLDSDRHVAVNCLFLLRTPILTLVKGPP